MKLFSGNARAQNIDLSVLLRNLFDNVLQQSKTVMGKRKQERYFPGYQGSDNCVADLKSMLSGSKLMSLPGPKPTN